MRHTLAVLALALAMTAATIIPAQAATKTRCSWDYVWYEAGRLVQWQQVCYLSHTTSRHVGWYWRLCRPGPTHVVCKPYTWQDHPYVWTWPT